MKLSLNGQWGEVSGLIYTYPDANSSEIPEWAKTLFDPRNAVRGIFKGDYCYALWYNNNGYYYSCIKTNTDSRNGCVMLTVFAGDMVPMDGEQIAEKMRMMLDYCLLKNDYTEINNNPDTLLKARDIEVLLTKRALPEDTSSTSEKEMAYRLYKNKAELGLIMENPYQPSYAGYKRILILEESAFGGEALYSQSITQITDPVRKTYDIRSDSADVHPSKESVMEGETFYITYTKAGYADERVDTIAKRPNAYYSIDSNVINLKSATAAGINFKREIILQVVDEETNSSVKKWSSRIDNNNRVENTDSRVIYRIDPNRPHKIVIYADGYEESSLDLAVDEHGIKTVRLHPCDNSVCIRLQYGKKEYKDVLRMKSNNELYKPLKKFEGEMLQVKRPFFSRRNMVPILLVFAIAAAAGVFLGRFTKKTPEVTPSGNDSTLVAQLQERVISLTTQVQSMEEVQNKNAEIDAELFTLYGKAVRLINEKTSVDAAGVSNMLSNSEFSSLLDGKMADKSKLKSSLEGLLNQLNSIVAPNQGGGSSRGGNTKGEPEDLDYFANNPDIWDLSKIQSEKYKKFVGFIKKGDIRNLKNYNGEGNSHDYYGNANWRIICVKLGAFWDENENNAEKVNVMSAQIQTYTNGDTFRLKDLANYLQ